MAILYWRKIPRESQDSNLELLGQQVTILILSQAAGQIQSFRS